MTIFTKKSLIVLMALQFASVTTILNASSKNSSPRRENISAKEAYEERVSTLKELADQIEEESRKQKHDDIRMLGYRIQLNNLRREIIAPSAAKLFKLKTENTLLETNLKDVTRENDLLETNLKDVTRENDTVKTKLDDAQRKNTFLKLFAFGTTATAFLMWNPAQNTLKSLLVSSLHGIGNALAPKK